MARSRPTGTVPVRRRDRAGAETPVPSTGSHFRVLIGSKEIGFCQITRLQAADGGAFGPEAAEAIARPSVVLRRAITQSKDLYLWRERAAAGKRDVRTVTIHQCDPVGRVLNTWVLHRCHPVRWLGPAFNALSSDVLWEEVEICCERLEWR